MAIYVTVVKIFDSKPKCQPYDHATGKVRGSLHILSQKNREI